MLLVYAVFGSSSPSALKASLLCGLLSCLIRFLGSYPEGVSFAILLMNILSPYIEKLCTKAPFGKVGKKNEAK